MLTVSITSQLKEMALDVSFEATSNGITTLFGPSGAGKSSILNMVAGLAKPDAGSICFEGKELFDSKHSINLKPEQRGFGYVFQEPCLFPHLSVAANLNYGSHSSSLPPLKRDDVIDLLGIGSLLDRKPKHLSGGEAQRVSIARALLSNPRMLLMDEPLSSLDRARKKEILPLLKSIPKEFERDILYISHSFDEVNQLSDQLVLIEDGKLIATGTPEELTTDPAYAMHLEGLDAGNLLKLTVKRHDEDYGLTELEFSGGIVPVPHLSQKIGENVRIRIRARDITLANTIPEGISTLIRLPATVLDVATIDATHSYVSLKTGDAKLMARITRKSIEALGIQKGASIFCLVKSVTIEN